MWSIQREEAGNVADWIPLPFSPSHSHTGVPKANYSSLLHAGYIGQEGNKVIYLKAFPVLYF